MNAVPTLPTQPEMPVAGTPTPGPRDDDPRRHASATAPSFMTALHKVSADKPSQASPDDQRDVPPSPSEEDQPIALQAEASLPATDGGDPQTMVLIKGEMTSALPGHDTHDLRGAAIGNGQLTGAAKATVVATATISEDEQGGARPYVPETQGASRAQDLETGRLASRSRSHWKTAGPVVLKTAEFKAAYGDPSGAAAMVKTRGPWPAGVSPQAPVTPGPDGDAPTGASTAGEGPRHDSTAQVVATGKRISPETGPGPQRPLAEDGQDLQRHAEAAARNTATPGHRRTDGSDRPISGTTSSAAAKLTIMPGRDAGHTASDSLETAPTARGVAASAGAPDGSALTADGERAQYHQRLGGGTEPALEAIRLDRTARLEADARPDGLAPVDRHGAPSVAKASTPTFVDSAPTSTDASFRSQNLDPIVERIALSIRGNQSEARIALKPDHLGSIRLQIATDNSTVHIKILTELPMARDLLESHLSQLKTDLQQQGLELEEIDVALDREAQHFRREGRRQQGGGRAPLGSGRPAKSSGGPPDPDVPPNRMADRRPAVSGIDFFA